MTEEETKCHWALGLFLCYFATNWVLRVQKHKCTKHFETQIHHSTCIRRLPTLLFWPFRSLHCTYSVIILRSNPKFTSRPKFFTNQMWPTQIWLQSIWRLQSTKPWSSCIGRTKFQEFENQLSEQTFLYHTKLKQKSNSLKRSSSSASQKWWSIYFLKIGQELKITRYTLSPIIEKI